MKITGTIRKLKSEHTDIINYSLPLGDKLVAMNELIGQEIKLEFTGNIYCVDTGNKIKKAYGQGYSWESFVTRPECDQCIFKPELCHYSSGTCRDPKWGEEHCFKPHVIYLSLTSDVKIGITRQTQVPTRWIDQGAVEAIRICEVKDRISSGRIEVEIASEMKDKTNWRNMLKNEYEETNLKELKNSVIKKFKSQLDKYGAKILDDTIYEFNYPVEVYPSKISSLNFDKNPIIESKLLGIKGQYLIFDSGVINMRKYQGYEVSLEA